MFWTDYPIAELGDESGKPAPVRPCQPIAYDGDKYCRVVVDGITTAFKSGYIYTQEGRSGDAPVICRKTLLELPRECPV